MKLTWLGHACFLLEEQGYRIVIDPYDGVAGYPPLQVSAHAVFCSHGHFDHNAVNCVTLLPETDPFSVREVQTFHDDLERRSAGRKHHPHLHGGRRVCSHLGDLGHQLTAAQLREIGSVDAALVPVGGVYTLDAAGQKRCATRCTPDVQSPCTITTHLTACRSWQGQRSS